MTERKQHGGPRPNSGGARAGAGRKPKEPRLRGIRPWVPVQSDAEAAAIMGMAPQERRLALLAHPTPGRPAGGGGEETDGDG